MFLAVFGADVGSTRQLAARADAVLASLHPLTPADAQGHWSDDRAHVFQSLIYNTPESRHEQLPTICPRTGRVVVAWIRVDNRDELITELDQQVMRSPGRAPTDPELLLAAYDRWGENCVAHFVGDFSFVIYDPAAATVFVGRDPLGVRPLFYARTTRGFVFSTSAAPMRVIPGLSLTTSESWIARFVTKVSASHTATAWNEVHKLPGGHHATIQLDAVGALDPVRWFSFRNDQPESGVTDDRWVREYRATLEEVVRCRLRTDYPLGAETTGGLDSSTCVGFAAHLWTRPMSELSTYGFISSEEEPDYVLKTGQRHGLVNQRTWAAVDLEPTAPVDHHALLGYPDEHGSATHHLTIYQACVQDEARTLLSGFGGDEVVTNPGGLWLTEMLDRGEYLRTLSELPGSVPMRPARLARRLWRSRASIQTGPSGPLVDMARQRVASSAVRPEVLARHDVVADSVHQARADSVHRTVNSFALDRLGSPYVSVRLETCSILAQAHGVDYRWPLLDVRLVQQYLSSPGVEKYHNGVGRYLHRRAIAEVVPAKVAWKASKSMGGTIRARPTPDPGKRVAELEANLHPQLVDIVDLESVSAPTTSPSAFAGHRNRELHRIEVVNNWLHTTA